MAKPKTQPIPESADTSDSDNDDDTEDDGPFDDIMSKLAGQKNSGLDANTLLMMQMQERVQRDAERYRREERENNRQRMMMFVALLTPVLPILVEKIFGKKDDPMLAKLLEGVLAKTNNTDMLKDFMGFMSTGNQTMLQNAITQLASVGSIKDQMYQEELKRMRERDDDDKETPQSHPIIEGMREARLLMESSGFKLGGTSTRAHTVALNDPIQPKIANAPEATPPVADTATPSNPPKAQPVAIFLRTLHGLHTQGDKTTAPQRIRIRSKLASVIIDDPILTQAILDGDRDALTKLGEPIVMNDPMLLEWIVKPGVDQWILEYISKQIGPILDELVNAEEYAEGEESETDPETEQQPATPVV